MDSVEIPPATAAFLGRMLGSVEELEVLMFLYRRPDRYRSVEDLGRELGMRTELVRCALEDLALRNLLDVRLSVDVLYRCMPGTKEMRDQLDRLAELYATSRTAVVAVVMSQPGSASSHVRSRSL